MRFNGWRYLAWSFGFGYLFWWLLTSGEVLFAKLYTPQISQLNPQVSMPLRAGQEYAPPLRLGRSPIYEAGGLRLGSHRNHIEATERALLPLKKAETVAFSIRFLPWQFRPAGYQLNQQYWAGLFWEGDHNVGGRPKHSIWLLPIPGKIKTAISNNESQVFAGNHPIKDWDHRKPWNAHLISTIDFGATKTYRLYVNGQIVIETPIAGDALREAPTLFLGNGIDPPVGLPGVYSDFTLFDRALSPDEATQLYQAQGPILASPLSPLAGLELPLIYEAFWSLWGLACLVSLGLSVRFLAQSFLGRPTGE